MKTAKQLFDKFLSDVAFRNEVLEDMEERRDAGASDPAGALVEAAAGLGFEVSAEQAAAFFAKVSTEAGELSDDDLEKIAGGFVLGELQSDLADGMIIDDKTGITWKQLTNLRRTGRIEG